MPRIDEVTVIRHFRNYLAGNEIEFLKGYEQERNTLISLLEKLIECEDHHEKLETGKKIWKLLFEHAMSYIDSDRRGYDKLFAMLDDYVEFEELMFASDPFYRDHTLHSLWVYFLGEYLFYNDKFSQLFKSFGQVFYGDEINRKAFELLECDVVHESRFDPSIRCVAALCHDLGYPIKKIGEINQAIAKILPHFSITTHQEFSFSYLPVQQGYLDGLVRIFSSNIQAKTASEEEFTKACKDHGIEKLFTSEGVAQLEKLPPSTRRKLGESFKQVYTIQTSRFAYLANLKEMENYQHGFMSVYLLAKYLPTFTSGEHILVETDEAQAISNPSRFFAKLMILAAMVSHSSSYFSMDKINSPMTFLTFVDELEEFSRISRANQKRQYVDQFCRTELEMLDGWLDINFIFNEGDPDHLNPEIFFKDKLKRFLRLFNVPSLDEELRLRLVVQDRLQEGEFRDFVLELARDYIRLKADDEIMDPGDYLGLVEFKHKKS